MSFTAANFQSLRLEEAFSQHKIPYRIENGLGFYSRPEVKKLLDYLRVISDPNSDAGDEALIIHSECPCPLYRQEGHHSA